MLKDFCFVRINLQRKKHRFSKSGVKSMQKRCSKTKKTNGGLENERN